MVENSNKSLVFVLGGLNYGGAERVASHLLNYWEKNGWDITLICRRGPENDFYSIPENLRRINLGGEGPSANKVVALLKNVPYVWQLRKALKKTDSPFVISFLTKTNIHTILACIGLKKKLIISERNDTTRQNYPRPWPLLRRVLYRFADIVTANSTIAVDGMKGYVPEKKLTVIPNPVYIPNEKATPEQSTVILNVGRLVPQKAQHLVIEAFSVMDRSMIENWCFEILGDGGEEKKLADLAKELHVSEYVKFHGLVNNPHSYYLNAGIFVLPSKYEGTPNALLEAMSYGLPCIVSDSLPGALEIINDGKNGFVFSFGNTEELAQKIECLIKSPQTRKKMGVQAREDVKKFSPENVMPLWNKLIR